MGDFSALSWVHEPRVWKVTNGCLSVNPDSETDFWKRTYYTPPIDKENGHIFGRTLPETDTVMETHFSYNPVNLFDQGGLAVYIDGDNWIKCGLEYVDGHSRLSVVVTRGGFSDWSTSLWPHSHVYLRCYRVRQSSYVVEASEDGKDWRFIRITHLGRDGSGGSGGADTRGQKSEDTVFGGAYCCCPTRAGGTMQFQTLSYRDCDGYTHKAESS
eukprot:Rmarinus@m.936